MRHAPINIDGLHNSTLHYNLSPAQLVEHAIARGEGELSATGALCVNTGTYTGRSPQDRFFVDSVSVHHEIDWNEINQPFPQARFDALYAKVTAYLQNRDVYVFDGFAGADARYRKGFRIINELAFQNLFIHQLLIRPSAEQLAEFEPDFTILAVLHFLCDPAGDAVHSQCALLIDLEHKRAIIAGTQYAGEIKKLVFSIMNYLMPMEGVLPMHCSANIGENGDTAIFFGLSGTGKTTLSADCSRRLIGDDEHGWADDTVFNFEGGCYAKCINLEQEKEPEIHQAIRFGAIMENVVLNPHTRMPDYSDASLTENTRAAYPIDFLPHAESTGIGGTPKTIIFLTADAYGVLPPVSKLDLNQMMYYFMSGFTSKLAGTECGVTEPVPVFSACFGAPFMPLHPSVYAQMLAEKVKKTNANVYLINTGWNGSGKRIKLFYTQAIVTAAISGALEKVEFVREPYFGLTVPTSCPGVPSEMLLPIDTWKDKDAYENKAKELAYAFIDNFKQYRNIPTEIILAGPKAIRAC